MHWLLGVSDLRPPLTSMQIYTDHNNRKEEKGFSSRKEKRVDAATAATATCYMLNSLFLKTAKALAVETLSPCPSFSKYASLHPYLCRCLRERIYISKACTNEKKNLKKVCRCWILYCIYCPLKEVAFVGLCFSCLFFYFAFFNRNHSSIMLLRS